MTQPQNTLRAAMATGLLLGLALSAACSPNKAGTLFAPTGIRPAPAVWPGSLTGRVLFDPLNTPDLSSPPYPPTRIELYEGPTLVAVDSLEALSPDFLFTGLRPGSYSVVVRSSAFLAGSRGGLTVRDIQTDAGNLTLLFNSGSVSNSIDLIGSMPGFGVDQFQTGTVTLDQNPTGVWTYPNTLGLGPPNSINPGVYRFKFTTDASLGPSNLIGWGWSDADTLTVPQSNHPAVKGSTLATDIVMRIPVAGVYMFTLDERRQTFSIALAPSAATTLSRR